MFGRHNAETLKAAYDYVRLTMTANYWFAKAPTNNDSVLWNRAYWYTKQAMKALHSIEDEYLQQNAMNQYHQDYKNGMTYRDYEDKN